MIVAPLPDVDEYWPLVEWAFDNFEERSGGDATAERLREMVRHDERQCWVAMDGERIFAVGLTEVLGPHKRVSFDFCTGRGREGWQDLMVQTIEKWAREIGSAGVRTYSRTGWTPFLRDQGYRETHRIMEKVF